MTCEMYVEDPYPFAWCETHDETFALGDLCPHHPDREAGR